MSAVNLIFPHQLFEEGELLQNGLPTYLIEEYLFFKQYAFHQQKLVLHRSSMKFYQDYLQEQEIEVNYVEAGDSWGDIRELIAHLSSEDIKEIHFYDPCDNWLLKRIEETSSAHDIECHQYDSPLFLNNLEDLQGFFEGKKRLLQAEFYKEQRLQRNILVEEGEPQGGKWSFDQENRKKYPKGKEAPAVEFPPSNEYFEEAVKYVKNHFAENPGKLKESPLYPGDFKQARKWLQSFLKTRFEEFGPYEDAIVADESILNHSVLTPMLNTGLLTPKLIIERSLEHASSHNIPINSLEGFIRQILGWREFIRGVYEFHGSEERTKNFWGFSRKIPPSFYDGTTGIDPVDLTIKKVLATGYCHHIERLMVLGNFMLLCEFDPDEVYRWFMELFIDAYDWVMVPNVYGMSQFADGGLMATKPYISGSNYLKKMSDFPKGEWEEVWDGLFWRFMHVHRDFFTSNPRLGMLIGTFDKMSSEKQEKHLANAQGYLDKLNDQP